MVRRFCFFLMIACLIASCDKFSVSKNKGLKSIDTIVDFSSVDVFPTFSNCDSLIDKAKQTECFRTTIQQEITNELSGFSLQVKKPVNEIVTVTIVINQKGSIVLKQLRTTKHVITQLPKLDSLLKVAIEGLPKIYPALKRGIPVATQYELPIQIKLEQ